MKAITWKAVFASMNPSPVFEAVAMLGEELAINGDELCANEIDEAVDSAVLNRLSNERLRSREADPSSKRLATWSASQSTRIATKRNARSVRMRG
jgi:hypothetical protein